MQAPQSPPVLQVVPKKVGTQRGTIQIGSQAAHELYDFSLPASWMKVSTTYPAASSKE